MDDIIWDLYPADAWNKTAQFGDKTISETKADRNNPFKELNKALSQLNEKIIDKEEANDVGNDLAYIVEIEYGGETKMYRYQARGNHRPMPDDPGRHKK